MINRNSNFKPKKWYHNETFPLLPIVTTKKANDYNTNR